MHWRPHYCEEEITERRDGRYTHAKHWVFGVFVLETKARCVAICDESSRYIPDHYVKRWMFGILVRDTFPKNGGI